MKDHRRQRCVKEPMAEYLHRTRKRENLQICNEIAQGCPRFETTCEMQERSYLSDSKTVFCCNLASFFLSSFMQLHKKMIREDRSLGRCKNHDTEEEPGGRLPLEDTATFHLSLGVKSGVRRRAGWRSSGPARKVQIKKKKKKKIYSFCCCLF